MNKLSKAIVGTFIIAALLVTAVAILAPAIVERKMNKVLPHSPYVISDSARQLHQSLFVADLHADSSLWKRDLLQYSQRGHVDIPRLREGNVALQIFGVVTKSPRGQNYSSNATDAPDNISALALMQAWPVASWSNLTERALYQAKKIQNTAQRAPQQLRVLRKRSDLTKLLSIRVSGQSLIGAILATEGSHALSGELSNIDTLYDAGFRMMGLQHFFDNKLGGSLHGSSGAGLSAFGKQAVDRMQEKSIIVDVAHSSPAVVEDVLARSRAPLVVSHSGFNGHCASERNISDNLMRRIAAADGLIGVGYWDAAVCDTSPASVVAALRYGIDLVGEEHVALGSDFDGAVNTSFDTAELAVLTDIMLREGFSEREIRLVMGENILQFLLNNLPKQ